MDIPSVSYVPTSDGYNIAYAVSGRGTPVVFVPIGITHLQLVWRHDPRVAPWLEQLRAHYQLVQYDNRGQGMSTRGLDGSHTIEDLELDLEAVIERLQLDRFVLFAYFYGVHVAIRYASKHPERVIAIVIVSGSISMEAWPLESLVGLAERNWEALLQNWVPATFTPQERDELIEYFKTCRSQADWVVAARAFSMSDVRDCLPALQAPTLVLHPRDFLWLSADESMKMAANIEGARFTLVDGALPLGDAAQNIDLVRRFIDDAQAPVARESDAQVFVAPTTSEQSVRAPLKRSSEASSPSATLSARQSEVLSLIAQGKTNKEIALSMQISLRTVERHVADLYSRLGIRNRSEATRFMLANQEPT